jgi:hypothetical protein
MRHAPTPNTFNQGNTLIIMLNRQLPRSLKSLALAGSAALLLTSAGAWAADPVIKPYFQFKKAPMVQLANDISLDTNGAQPPVFNAAPGYLLGFEGVSQYDGASLGRNAIPPDTMGAVGRTQYMVTTNGAYAVYNKTDGTRLSLLSDSAFWISAGQTGTNGDTRLMYNADASRWVMVAFGSNVKDLNVAVSDTDNALGPWKSVKFEGYAGLGFGGTADYPTLALDKNAVYIGTNNFAPATSGGVNSFRGTTMNVLPLNDLFKPDLSAPSAAGLKQFVTPFTGGAGDVDRGFAQQGVNSNRTGSSTGKVVAASAFLLDNLAFNDIGRSRHRDRTRFHQRRSVHQSRCCTPAVGGHSGQPAHRRRAGRASEQQRVRSQRPHLHGHDGQLRRRPAGRSPRPLDGAGLQHLLDPCAGRYWPSRFRLLPGLNCRQRRRPGGDWLQPLRARFDQRQDQLHGPKLQYGGRWRLGAHQRRVAAQGQPDRRLPQRFGLRPRF